MKIRFETTMDDLIAFNRFHFRNSPTWRRQVWVNCLIIPCCLAGLLLLIALNRREFDGGPMDISDPFLVILGSTFLVISVVWCIFIRWYLYWTLGRNTRKYLAEGSNRLMFGWREMEIVNNRLILKTELMHNSLDLRAIEKIVADDQYTYVYISAAGAYLIPMTLYPEDEYAEFVAELREAWDNRDAPRPPDEPDALPRQTDARIAERPR